MISTIHDLTELINFYVKKERTLRDAQVHLQSVGNMLEEYYKRAGEDERDKIIVAQKYLHRCAKAINSPHDLKDLRLDAFNLEETLRYLRFESRLKNNDIEP